jgi:hypothetical protein
MPVRSINQYYRSDWQSYCPNAATLIALNAQPWAARSEW